MNRPDHITAHWPVRRFLFWLVLACLLPGVLGAGILFAAQYREGRAQQEKDMLRTVRALSQVLDSHLLRGQAVAQALATRDHLAQSDYETFHQGVRELLANGRLGTNIVLRDRDGRPLLNTAVPFGQPLPDPSPERVEEVFSTGKPVISNMFIGDVFNRPIMTISVPVVIGGEIVYALSIGFLPDQFSQLLKSQNLPPGWIAALYDRTGTIVGRNITPEKYVGSKISQKLSDAIVAEPEGALDTISKEGTPVFTVYSRSLKTGWAVAVGIPRDALRNELLQRLAQLGVGVAALFALGLVLARYIGRRIADSVRALIAPAMALGEGGSVPIPEVHVREAAEVADGIRRAGELQQQRADVLRKQDAALRRSEAAALEAVREAEVVIKERMKAEEALRQTDRRKDEFLAMLAHELRNPLAPIAAAAELLDSGKLDPARIGQVSEIISRQAKHMTGLVDDLLDVSRVTRGLVTLQEKMLDIRGIINDAVEQVKPATQSRRQQLTVDVPDAPACVMGDHKRLVQVVTNLLTNASKFTPEGGNINVQVTSTGGRLEIVVIDDGVGMMPDLVDRAFQLFAQGERSLDRSQGGLGIGLALVKSLVVLHGGTVDACSDGPGKGSRFTISLPMVACSDEVLDAAGGDVRAPVAQRAPLKVLIVDDNADAAKMLAMYVESAGHQVVVEYDSAAALRRASNLQPDVCLLDIGLPGMDGNELARRLRADERTSRAVLVAVTGYGQLHERNQAFAAGFDHHLVKPVDLARLTGILAATATVQS